MRFSTYFADPTSIELLIKTVQTMSRLGKLCVLKIDNNSITFIQNENVKDNQHTMHMRLCSDTMFENVRFAGASDASPHIYVEFVTDELATLLQPCVQAKSMRIRLVRKEDSPFLTFDLKMQTGRSLDTRTITHDIPILVECAPSAPLVPDAQITITMPPLRKLTRVVLAYKNMGCRYITLAANFNRELELRGETDKVNVRSYFSDLVVHGDDEDRQRHRDAQARLTFYTTRIDTRLLVQFVQCQNLFGNRLLLAISHHRCAYITYNDADDDFSMQYVLRGVTLGE